jgi:imidazole glycerol-phosphate synthase subunit HisF
MLKRRLIPKLQLKAVQMGGRERMALVTTVGFDHVVEIGDPISQAKIYQAQAADELIFVDLDATHHQRGAMVNVVRKAAEQIFMPITVGGGVQSVEDIRLMLQNGADKVSINTAAVHRQGFIEEASSMFGAQCVVVSIDFRRQADGGALVYTHGGRQATSLDAVAWAVEVERRGAGEILLTSIDRDGSHQGLDLEITRQVTSAVRIPVIAAGGCGLASHFSDGFLLGGADAVSAGTFFCHKDQNPMQTRAHIRNAGIPIRLHT